VCCLARSKRAGGCGIAAQRHPYYAGHGSRRPHGFLGSKRGLTPNLDMLARESVVFTRAYSQVPLTAPSHASILTGTYPQFNQVTDFQIPLAQELPYAPEILRAHGYHTAAFVGAIILDPTARFAPGFDRDLIPTTPVSAPGTREKIATARRSAGAAKS